jgi:hypothetical protein
MLRSPRDAILPLTSMPSMVSMDLPCIPTCKGVQSNQLGSRRTHRVSHIQFKSYSSSFLLTRFLSRLFELFKYLLNLFQAFRYLIFILGFIQHSNMRFSQAPCVLIGQSVLVLFHTSFEKGQQVVMDLFYRAGWSFPYIHKDTLGSHLSRFSDEHIPAFRRTAYRVQFAV